MTFSSNRLPDLPETFKRKSPLANSLYCTWMPMVPGWQEKAAEDLDDPPLLG
ncbi:MAG: hypothetical protein ABI600_16625 [Luteolibacter sp.]